MIATTLAATLVDRGLDFGELPAKRALFEQVLEAGDVLGIAVESAWWAPGRLEVFGKHTDYAGGRSLVCAVPRGFAIAAAARHDGLLRVVDARDGKPVTLRAASGARPLSGWAHYVEVVARRLARNFPGSDIAGDIVFASDLPRAAGMSSSSALMVGIAAALGQLAGLEQRSEWRDNIRSTIDAAGYYACIENGMTFGTLTGDAGVGTHGGSEDHAAILMGLPARLTAYAFVPMRRLDSVTVPERWSFVLAPSGVVSEKTGAARDSYNRLSGGATRLLELWNEAHPRAASLASALRSSESAADELRALVRRTTTGGWPAPSLENRLDHFIREDARILQAVQACRDADVTSLAHLAYDSQADAETLLGNQIPETSALTRSARDLGAFAACSFGAGFGGSVWALIDAAEAEAFARRWRSDAFVARPGPPLTVASPDRSPTRSRDGV
jgi:galactokinase